MPEGQAIGQVVYAKGEALAEAADGVRMLAEGSPIYANDVLVTGAGANLEVRFADDSVLSQGADSTSTIDSYVFDPTDPGAGEYLIQMAQGGFRMVTGKIAESNPDGVHLASPLASIGIRGTTTVHQVGADGLEKHGVEDLTGGQSLLLGDQFGNIQVITTSLGIIDFTPGRPMGQVRSFTPQEQADFQAMAPFVSQGEPEPEDDGGDEAPDETGDQPPDDAAGEGEGEGVGEGEGEGVGDGEGEGVEGDLDGDGMPDILGEGLDFGLFENLQIATPGQQFDNPLGEFVTGGNTVVDEPEEPIVLIEPDEDKYDKKDVDDASPTKTLEDKADHYESGYGYWASDPLNDGTYNLVHGTSGNDSSSPNNVEGSSGVNNVLFGLEGNDDVSNYNGNHGLMFGGAGDDTMSGSNTYCDTMWGGTGNDHMSGHVGYDYLYGNGGSDTLEGGADADSLVGGAGTDYYYYSTVSSSYGNDSIYGDHDDKGAVEETAFNSSDGYYSGIASGSYKVLQSSDFVTWHSNSQGSYDGSEAVFGDTYAGFVWDADASKLYYDSDGDNTASAVLVATIDGTGFGADLEAGDILIVNWM